MKPNVLLVLVVIPIGGALAVGTSLPRGAPNGQTPIQPEANAAEQVSSPVRWSGPRSQIRDQRLIQVGDQESWSRLWSEHQGEHVERLIAHGGGVAAPRIDFERFLIVAMFRGDSTNCDGERLVSLHERPQDLFLRFDSYSFQTMSIDGPDHGEAVRPYGIWVVPRTGKPITVEENTQGMLDREPTWTWRKTFPAP